jgi:hypothetical protein
MKTCWVTSRLMQVHIRRLLIYTGNVTKYVCCVSVRLIRHGKLNTEDPKSQSNYVDVLRIATGHHCSWKTFTSDPFVLTLLVAVKTSMEQWWDDKKRGKLTYGEKEWGRFFLFRFLSIYRQTTSEFAKHVFYCRVRIMQLLAICRLCHACAKGAQCFHIVIQGCLMMDGLHQTETCGKITTGIVRY